MAKQTMVIALAVTEGLLAGGALRHHTAIAFAPRRTCANM